MFELCHRQKICIHLQLQLSYVTQIGLVEVYLLRSFRKHLWFCSSSNTLGILLAIENHISCLSCTHTHQTTFPLIWWTEFRSANYKPVNSLPTHETSQWLWVTLLSIQKIPGSIQWMQTNNPDTLQTFPVFPAKCQVTTSDYTMATSFNILLNLLFPNHSTTERCILWDTDDTIG